MGTPLNAAGGYCVVIPTFNNGGTVREVVESTLAQAQTVIVVDDGCTDDTGEALAGLPIVMLRHKRNRGKGVALRSGFKRARELGFTHAITLDSDGQHDPAEIHKLVSASRSAPDAIVVGVRDMSGADVPPSAGWGRMVSNFWLKVATGIEVRDTQSGFRVYPLRHVTRLRCFGRRFTYECEILIRHAWGGCPVLGVPIGVFYPPRPERVTHFQPIRDNIRFICLYLYMNFSHLLIPLPHKRLLPRSEPVWTGSLGGSMHALWRRLRTMAVLPQRAQLKGGPWARLRQLFRFLAREKSTPGELGLAVGIGAFIGCSPLIGIHWILALYAATRMHLNRVACLAASNISFGPLTAVIALASLSLGKLMTGGHFYVPMTLNRYTVAYAVDGALLEWVLGSLVIGLAAALATGLGTLYGVRALRRRRIGPNDTGHPPEAESVEAPALRTEASA